LFCIDLKKDQAGKMPGRAYECSGKVPDRILAGGIGFMAYGFVAFFHGIFDGKA
jgi:hypothetical protein